MTPRWGPFLASGFLALGLAACASNGEGSASSEVAGCYQFERTGSAGELGLPWGFELLDEPLTEWTNIPDGRVARTRVTESTVRDHPFGFWSETESDSIRVGHPGGGGFSLTLAADGQDLVGSARPVGDAVAFGEDFGPREPGPVVARRVVCPNREGA